MLLRRFSPLALALAALACEPEVPFSTNENPSKVDYGGFDPTGNPPIIPLPNDLALQPQAIATQNPTQAALLSQWQTEGFPNDQEVPITLNLIRQTIDPNTGKATTSAPPIDLASITLDTLQVFSLSSAGSGAVAYDPPKAADYNTTTGILTIHKSPDASYHNSRRWPAGTTIVVALRGGANGVKVTDNPVGLSPQPAMFLLLQDKDLTLPENLPIIPGNTREEKRTNATQLEALRKQYLLPFGALDQLGHFKHPEIATFATFKVASTSKRAHVETDPSGGLIPLPSDFLFAPDPNQGNQPRLLPELAAPTGPFGALGAGLATLDGFSTTAMELSQTSSPIQAATVNKDTVFIFELNTSVSPPTATRLAEVAEIAQGKVPRFLAEPPPIVQSGLSTAIGLQPAIPVQVPGGPFLALPPLKESTTYVVIVTDRVKDLNGDALVRSTLGKILLLDASLSISAGGKSQISGVTDAQAVGLDQMRRAITLAAGTLQQEKGSAYSRDHIVMAYTFKTQSITDAPDRLAALPYAPACSSSVTTNCLPAAAVTALSVPVTGTTAIYCSNPTACPAGDVTSVYNRYGADIATVPLANIGAIVESTILTLNNLTDPSGAFSDPTKVAPALEPIPVIIATPGVPVGGTCIPAAGAPCVAPLVVFRHGLNGNRASLLLVADRLAAAGFVVAAIDAAKHGARSYCMPAKNGTPAAECVSGSTCVADPALANQGDTTAGGGTPGKCSGATATDPKFVNRPVLCPGTGCATAIANAGTPVASGNYLISANFFRTRDTLRQDVIDQSQLIHVLAVNPTAPPANAAIFNAIASTGVVIDPTKIYFVGQSLGGIQGAVDIAVNPRITKAALNVSGETIVDVFTNSPSLGPGLNALLAGLGIIAGTPAYLQFVNVAKWILDPADPANFGDHITRGTLTNYIKTGLPPPLNSDPMLAKKVMGQYAVCDQVVPNGFNLLQFKHIGLGPDAAPATTGTLTQFASASSPPDASCSTGGAVKHGFLTDWVTYPNGGSANITQKAQDDIAGFFNADAHPPQTQFAP